MGAYGDDCSRLRNFGGFKLVTNLKETKAAMCKATIIITIVTYINATCYSAYIWLTICHWVTKMQRYYKTHVLLGIAA